MSTSLLEPRYSYKPFMYPQAYEFWEQHQLSFWLWNEPSMTEDVINWEQHLTSAEKTVVGGILKGFAQTECLVNNYWIKAALWFPHPEITAMCAQFAEAEGRHAKAYNFLNEILELEEYDAFLQEPEVAERLGNLLNVKDDSQEEMARSLAVFSGFCEGVSLFCAFAVLLHFSRHNKLKGMGKMIEWSSKDELLHSTAGIWLFNTLLKEFPHLNTETLKESVYEGARVAIELEDNYLDFVFKEGDIPGLAEYDVKQFIRGRANNKLIELGYDHIFPVDLEASDRIASFFDDGMASNVEADFFANVEANYSKRAISDDELDW